MGIKRIRKQSVRIELVSREERKVTTMLSNAMDTTVGVIINATCISDSVSFYQGYTH